MPIFYAVYIFLTVPFGVVNGFDMLFDPTNFWGLLNILFLTLCVMSAFGMSYTLVKADKEEKARKERADKMEYEKAMTIINHRRYLKHQIKTGQLHPDALYDYDKQNFRWYLLNYMTESEKQDIYVEFCKVSEWSMKVRNEQGKPLNKYFKRRIEMWTLYGINSSETGFIGWAQECRFDGYDKICKGDYR